MLGGKCCRAPLAASLHRWGNCSSQQGTCKFKVTRCLDSFRFFCVLITTYSSPQLNTLSSCPGVAHTLHSWFSYLLIKQMQFIVGLGVGMLLPCFLAKFKYVILGEYFLAHFSQRRQGSRRKVFRKSFRRRGLQPKSGLGHRWPWSLDPCYLFSRGWEPGLDFDVIGLLGACLFLCQGNREDICIPVYPPSQGGRAIGGVT